MNYANREKAEKICQKMQEIDKAIAAFTSLINLGPTAVLKIENAELRSTMFIESGIGTQFIHRMKSAIVNELAEQRKELAAQLAPL